MDDLIPTASSFEALMLPARYGLPKVFPVLILSGIDRHGVDLRRGRSRKSLRADIGQRVRRKRAVRALRQSNEPMAADLLLDGSREGVRRGGIGAGGTAPGR
ncbi:hypothetical protein NXW09_29405 [Bacteroides ovatus]|nr:hypothetical protein [Bacteroides ovatus]